MSDYIEPTKSEHFLDGIESLKGYIADKRPLDSFLEAVVRNNLTESVMYADHINIRLIPDYVQWLYEHAPRRAWGFEESYVYWLKKEGSGE